MYTIYARVTFLLLVLVVVPRSQGEEPANMETITATLQQWRDSLVNVQFSCTSTVEYSEQAAREEGLEGIVFRRDFEWAWTDSGMRRRHTMRYRNGQLHDRSMRLVDGTARYTVQFPDGESRVDAPSQVLKAPVDAGGKTLIEPLFGLWFPAASQWLPELVSAGKAELLDPVIEEGTAYPLLRVKRAGTADFYLYVILDPKHAYLPRGAYNGFGSGKKSKFRQTVTNFQQLEGGIWFPAAGEYRSVHDGETRTKLQWRMTEVLVNRKISKKQFQPKLPAGTPVTDLVTGKTKFDGRRGKRRELESKRVAEAHENLANRVGGEAGVSARPVRGWSSVTYYVLFAIAAISLVTAFKIKRSTG